MLPHLTATNAMTPEQHRQKAIDSGLELGPIETRGFPWGPRKPHDGEVYGRLTVVAPVRQPEGLRWLVLCKCGKYRHHNWDNISRGRVTSCGCYQQECRELPELRYKKHGQHLSRTYKIWCCMKARCLDENHRSFKYYGSRGITVCDRWKNSFKLFFEDMGECPPGYSIERDDVYGNYEPSNCRWIPLKDQAKNRRKPKRRYACSSH